VSAKLRVLLADDELLARKRLHRLLSAMPDVELVGECTSGEEVLAAVESADADVLLLDIDMPGLSGIETKALLGAGRPHVIFATAHPEHALAAFDVGAIDYVLKPIEAARLATALGRARTSLAQRAGAPDEPASRLAIPTREGARLVDAASITHAIFDGTLVTVHVEGEALLTEQTLADLEARLPTASFERVHRRALLNLERVVRLLDQETGGYLAVTDTGARVEVSRQSARRLRRRLGL
jgi:two-component system LytT family response regulator